MPPVQQTQWLTDNCRCLDDTSDSTALCRLASAGWKIDKMPAVITLEMRGALPKRNAGAYLALGMANRQCNMDLHDLTAKHMQIMINTHHMVRRHKGYATSRMC